MQTIKPDWKEFLRFGEELLAQPAVASQCEWICQWIETKLTATAELWANGGYQSHFDVPAGFQAANRSGFGYLAVAAYAGFQCGN